MHETLSTDVQVIQSDPSPAAFAGCLHQNVVVAGGSALALAWAFALMPVAANVTLVHEDDRFAGPPAAVEALRAAHASMQLRLIEGTIERLVEANGRLRAVHVRAARSRVLVCASRVFACRDVRLPSAATGAAPPSTRRGSSPFTLELARL